MDKSDKSISIVLMLIVSMAFVFTSLLMVLSHYLDSIECNSVMELI